MGERGRGRGRRKRVGRKREGEREERQREGIEREQDREGVEKEARAKRYGKQLSLYCGIILTLFIYYVKQKSKKNMDTILNQLVFLYFTTAGKSVANNTQIGEGLPDYM